jgi:hypothetical protein
MLKSSFKTFGINFGRKNTSHEYQWSGLGISSNYEDTKTSLWLIFQPFFDA